MKAVILISFLFPIAFISCAQKKPSDSKSKENIAKEWALSDSEWKARLSEMEYYVLREKGTERAYTGDLLKIKEKGTYVCAACKLPLFESTTKFESGTGWPSFFQPIVKENIAEKSDLAYGMVRTEVLCNRCGGHLGHVFTDGPRPTGLRYCINSVSMDFVEAKTKAD